MPGCMCGHLGNEGGSRPERHEKKEPPPELKAQMDEMEKLSLGEPEFFDLKEPWLYSPR
jgi:hypothetical protein